MTLEKALMKYKEQEELIKSELFPDEEIKHCIDDSGDGRYFFPQWCVTTKGEIWSLSRKKWNRLSIRYDKYNGGIDAYVGNTNIPINEMVAHYFGSSNVSIPAILDAYYTSF